MAWRISHPSPLAARHLAGLRRRGKGGSSAPDFNPDLPPVEHPFLGWCWWVPTSPWPTSQLERLLEQPGCGGVELQVARLQRILEGPMPDRLLESMEAAWGERLRGVLASGRTPVFFSSRGEAACRHADERRALGVTLARLMGRVVARLAPGLGYVISKGGITTHTLLAEGLQLGAVESDGPALARPLVWC